MEEFLRKLKREFNVNSSYSNDTIVGICKRLREDYDINIYGKMSVKENGDLSYVGVIESFQFKNDEYCTIETETDIHDTYDEAIIDAINSVIGDEQMHIIG